MEIVGLTLLLIGILGFIAGFVQGFTALTTVTILMGSLTMFGGLPVHTSIGTAFIADAAIAFSIFLIYWKEENFSLSSAAPIIIGSAIGIQIAARIAGRLPEFTLGSLFTLGMLITGIMFVARSRREENSITLWRKRLESFPIAKDLIEWLKDSRIRKVFLFAWGFGIGLFGGLFGFSGGLSTMIFLVFLFDFDLHTALGTAIAVMSLISIFGGIGYASLSFFNIEIAIVAGIGGVTGGQLSSRIAQKFSEKKLNLTSGLVFLAIGLAFLSYLTFLS